MLVASQVWLLLAATIEPIFSFQACLNKQTHPEEEEKKLSAVKDSTRQQEGTC